MIEKIYRALPLDHALIDRLDKKNPAVWLATWGGAGFIKGAPGTYGSIAALPVAVILMTIGGGAWLLMGLLVLIIVGYRAAAQFEALSGQHDSGAIVIDEVAGMWTALLFAPPGYLVFFLALVLFRIFDILKPWPVSWFDRRPGAFGIMADDIAAGLYAGLCLWGLHYAGLV